MCYGMETTMRITKRTNFFICEGITTTVMGIEFVGDRILYVIPRSFWCDIFVNMHDALRTKDSFSKELQQVFGQLPNYQMKNQYQLRK
jgi:hypothetical protein